MVIVWLQAGQEVSAKISIIGCSSKELESDVFFCNCSLAVIEVYQIDCPIKWPYNCAFIAFFRKAVPIKMEYLRDAILGCCLNLLLCDKNANFYINMKNRPDITRAYGCRRYVGQKAAGS